MVGTKAPETARETATEPSPARPRLSALRRRRVIWLSALVAACTVVMQWVIMPPPLYYDPSYVFEAARRWPDIPLGQWPFNEVPHQVARMGLVLPARLVQELLGTGQASYFVIAAIGGCLFFVGCYLAVRSLFGDLVGLTATLLLLVHPFFTLTNPFTKEVTWSAGVMLPDMPGAGLLAMGVAGLVVASRREGRAQTYYLLAAGACFGSAFLVREFLAFVYVGIPVFLLLLGIPWRRLRTVAAPMAGILVVNLIHNTLVFGGPLDGLRSAATHGGAPTEPVTRSLALNSFGRAMYDWHPLGAVFLVALGLNVLGWVITRDRRLALTLVWFFSLCAPLTLLSGLLDPADITLRGWLVRYWFAVFPALLAGGLGAVVLLAQRFKVRGRPALAGLAAAACLAYLVAAVAAIPALPRDTAWNELRVWLDDRDDLPVIWADRRLGQTLDFYTRSMWGDRQWKGQIRDFPHITPTLPAEAGKGPLLYTRWRGQEPQIAGGIKPGPETGWHLRWRSSDGILEIWDKT